MFDPVTFSYPVAWVNPEILRASAALPAAGAWDATPTELNVFGASTVTLSFSYTRGAAGGAFDWQLWTSIYSVVGNVPAGAQEWVAESVLAVGAVAAGVDTQSLAQRDYQTYTSQGAAVEAFVFGPIELAGVERIRIRARESGAVGTPGTLQITGELMP